MSDQRDFRLIAYVVITAGVILAFATAVVPHYTAGHVLLFDVLLIGLLPYVVYGAFVTVIRGWPLLVAGALVLGIDAAVKIPERFLRDEVLATHAVYYAPLVSTLVVLPVVLGLGALITKRRRARSAYVSRLPLPPNSSSSFLAASGSSGAPPPPLNKASILALAACAFVGSGAAYAPDPGLK